METTRSVSMDADECDSFLGVGGTGVLSFAGSSEEPPHSVPVSYGYDEATSAFYFRLAVGTDSEKREVLDRPITFVVYGQEGGDWHSVVATGRLEATTEPSIATESLQGLEGVHIPLVDIFGRPPRDVPFEFYRLDIEELTGRKESPTEV